MQKWFTPKFLIFAFLITLLALGPVVNAAQAADGSTPVYWFEWGTSGMEAQQFLSPYGVELGLDEKVYAADTENNRIQVFSAAGVFEKTLGENQLNAPRGVTADADGNVYVADTNAHRVVKIQPDGTLTMLAGGYGSAFDTNTNTVQFNRPADITLDALNNWLYVADTYNHRVIRLGLDGHPLAVWGGPTYGSDAAHFYAPSGVTVDAEGSLYVADTLNNRVVKITSGGERSQWGGPTAGTSNGQYKQPRGIAAAKNANTGTSYIYVADTGNQRIQKFTTGGEFLYKWGTAGGEKNQFANPYAVAAQTEDTLYIADTGNDRIQAFEPNYAPDGLVIDPASIQESNLMGARVGDFSGHDVNTGDMLFYSLVSIAGQDCTGNSSFNLIGKALYAGERFDYEDKNSYAICARVTDSVGAYYETSLTITILDGSDAPVFDDVAFSIPESTTAVPNLGGTVGTLAAFDNDTGENLTFSIESGPYSDAFQVEKINATSAALKVSNDMAKAAVLDYETVPNHQVTVVVRTTDQLDLSDTATVTVTLNPVNDPPVITIPVEPFSVEENSPRGTPVGTISITDVDTPLSSLTLTDDNSAFTFDSAGMIKVYNVPNYELVSSYSYTVTVKDGTSTVKSGPITINVIDIDEPPALPTSYSVAENTPNGTVLILATDPENQPITYEMVLDESNGVFAVDSSGQLVVNNASVLNYETLAIKYFYITIKAKDSSQNASQVRVKMNITNVNEPPIFNPVQLSVRENTDIGVQIGEVTAADPEGYALSYSTVTDPTNPFSIIDTATSPVKGAIKVISKTLLNHETLSTYDLSVTVKDKYNVSTTQTFAVNIVDVNEPIVVDDQAFTAGDRSAAGTVIGKVAFKDPDEGTKPIFTITDSALSNDALKYFNIDKNTGDVTVITSAGLDYDVKNVYTINILVSDNKSGTSDPALSDTAKITINLTNSNDPPMFQDATFTIPENSPAGTVVGTVQAIDKEGGTVKYSIEGSPAAFAIDATTGQVTVADQTSLDYEKAANHAVDLVVRAADNGDPIMSDAHTYKVNLSNVNEVPTISDQSISVREKSADGTVVGTVSAKDPDGSAVTYEVTGGTGQNVFAVNTTNGKITVKTGGSSQIKYANTPFTLVVKVHDAGPLYSNPATVTINIEPLADLAIDSVTSTQYVLTGSVDPYTIVIKNLGAGSSTPYILNVYLPVEVSFVASGSKSGCVAPADHVECSLPALASGASTVVVINASFSNGIPNNTPLTTHASLLINDGNDLNASNNGKTNELIALTTFTVADDTFNKQAIPEGWSPAMQASIPGQIGEGFMGEYGAETVTFQRPVLPHSNVELWFELYVIRSWDGVGEPGPDFWKFIVGDLNNPGGTLLNFVNTTFSNWINDPLKLHKQSHPDNYQQGTYAARTGAEINRELPFSAGSPDLKDSVYKFHFIFKHKDPTLILNFIGEGLESKTDESWGIDNVKIVISGDKNFYQFIPMLSR